MAKAKRPPSRGAWLRRTSEEAVAERHELARELLPHELAALEFQSAVQGVRELPDDRAFHLLRRGTGIYQVAAVHY